MKSVPIIDSFKFTFLMIKRNYLFLLMLSFINFIFSMIYLCIADFPIMTSATVSPTHFNLMNLILKLVVTLPNMIIAILFIKLGLKGYDSEDKSIRWKEVWFPSITSMLSIFSKYFLVIWLYVIFIMLGFLLLIVPGIVVFLVFLFVEQILIEQNLPIEKVFLASVPLTRGIKWKLFGYNLIMFLFIIPGYLLNYYQPYTLILWKGLIGVAFMSFIYIPIARLSATYLYKVIQHESVLIK